MILVKYFWDPDVFYPFRVIPITPTLHVGGEPHSLFTDYPDTAGDQETWSTFLFNGKV